MPEDRVLTTGQVARICRVAPRTVSKWFDRGQLQGYKIPGSRDRRIPVKQLLQFMKEHGIPTDALEAHAHTTLIVARRGPESNAWAELLQTRTEVHRAACLIEAGVLIERLHPDCVVIDWSEFGDVLSACDPTALTMLKGTRVVAVGPHAVQTLDSGLKPAAAPPAGLIHASVSTPADRTALLGAVLSRADN
ncbi:MAG: hypothetical protein CHACPFDD_00425 [Phycisphaerae bacterium]|nr:hypothetical protein [Phycisphaerae bacterium]